MNINLAKTEIIHFVGIGGIGMSGLALIMKGLGFKIQGSDISKNKNIERLRQSKIKVFVGHKSLNVKDATILVISSAIKSNNVELKAAKKLNLPVYKRGDMLAHITSLKKNIVVAGSHGKTTTTSLIAAIFSEAKLDPTIINGGVINSLKNSARLGKSDWSILESDESDGSFTKVPPTYAVVTNIDREHMDFYKSIHNLKDHFKNFIKNVPSFGKTFLCTDDKNNRDLIKTIKMKNFLTYGIKKDSNFVIKNIKNFSDKSSFNIELNLPNKRKTKIKNITLPLIGLHNVRNATAAVATSFYMGISSKIIKKGLKNFKGVQRRFNKIFCYQNVDFYDDYAHHPTEIKEVINGVAQSLKGKEIVCVFQPHRVSRLNDLKKEFCQSFKKTSKVILCPVFTAGEKIKLNFRYYDFAKELALRSNSQVYLIKDKKDLTNYFKHNLNGNEVVIGMGAGSISNWIRDLSGELQT